VSNTAALESEMQSLAARLRKARQGLSRGTIVDLTPIEQDVKWLCRSVETLPAEEAASLGTEVARELDWRGPLFVVSAATGGGCQALCEAVMRHLEQLPAAASA